MIEEYITTITFPSILRLLLFKIFSSIKIIHSEILTFLNLIKNLNWIIPSFLLKCKFFVLSTAVSRVIYISTLVWCEWSDFKWEEYILSMSRKPQFCFLNKIDIVLVLNLQQLILHLPLIWLYEKKCLFLNISFTLKALP